MRKILGRAEILLIVFIAMAPLFGTFPYRLNIFLSYEGAYRLAQAQTPYKDFGIPLGPVYWVVPAIFFKIFGAQLITLLKAQTFLNICAGLAFRSILKSLSVTPGIKFLSVLLFVFSYSFFNYWPWYNHTVIVYEIISLAFLLKFIFGEPTKWRLAWLLLAALFINLSFFTKQDGGGMGLLISLAIITYHAWQQKSWKQLLIYMGTTFLTGCCFVLPFLRYGFGYWFNHGQPPHTARVAPMDIAGDFFSSSQWIKFYLLMLVLLVLANIKKGKDIQQQPRTIIFTLLTLGILFEAAIFQVTSYVPQDNNIFFHSFAFAFLLSMLAPFLPLQFESTRVLVTASIAVLLWWSQTYWRYVEKYAAKVLGERKTGDGVVNKNTYLILGQDSTDVPLNLWRTVPLKSFEKMLVPGPTAEGIERIMKMQEFKNPNAKVLNMSELTPLANELHYKLETGTHYPLWYHQGVGMFQKQTDMFCNRIQNNYYDVVIFEYIPYLNNFYPFKVHDVLLKNYKQVDKFTAPRKPSFQAWVEVYVRK
jgi:hypothetical protein